MKGKLRIKSEEGQCVGEQEQPTIKSHTPYSSAHLRVESQDSEKGEREIFLCCEEGSFLVSFCLHFYHVAAIRSHQPQPLRHHREGHRRVHMVSLSLSISLTHRVFFFLGWLFCTYEQEHHENMWTFEFVVTCMLLRCRGLFLGVKGFSWWAWLIITDPLYDQRWELGRHDQLSVLLCNTWFCSSPFKTTLEIFGLNSWYLMNLNIARRRLLSPMISLPRLFLLLVFHIFFFLWYTVFSLHVLPPVHYFFVREGVVFRIWDVYFTLYFSGYALVWLYSDFDLFKDELALFFWN